ncbi:hypothetical protein [Novipirellula caenicola]|uniref:hypothetical protein n=1 Tax=Novipirellula caenicola TaxID=1536901 RepID=UPI0031F1BCD4
MASKLCPSEVQRGYNVVGGVVSSLLCGVDSVLTLRTPLHDMKSTKRKPNIESFVSEAESRLATTHQLVEDMAKGNPRAEKPSEEDGSTNVRSAKPANSRSVVVRATEGLVRLEQQRRRRALLRSLLVLCIVLAIGYAIHYGLSTWLGMDPITHVWELIRVRLPFDKEA